MYKNEVSFVADNNLRLGTYRKKRMRKTKYTMKGRLQDCYRQTAATFSRWFLVHGFFYPEDGGDTFLRNVGSHKIYTAPHPRRRHS
jgi:hypothetical protein